MKGDAAGQVTGREGRRSVAGYIERGVDRRVAWLVLLSLIAATLVLATAAPANAGPREDARTGVFCRRADVRVNPEHTPQAVDPNARAAKAFARGYVGDVGQAHRTCASVGRDRTPVSFGERPTDAHRPRPV